MSNKKLFFKYLFSTIVSAAIVSIYSIVDGICVGQYAGPVGSAAIASAMPIWSIVYSFGILFGIGGATLMTIMKAKGNEKEGNSYFTLAFFMTLCVAIILWILFIFFIDDLLIFFGAKNKDVLKAAKEYALCIMITLPFFVFVNYLNAFVRNDNNTILTTIAASAGGIFNIFGDIFFVFDFGLGMGIMGAGLATAIGQGITVLILLIHFIRKKNTLKFTKVKHIFSKIREIIKIGVSAFILDLCIGIVIVIFNNQINRYTMNDATYLGVFGIISNMLTLVQGFSYAIGQANQPLLSSAFGMGNDKCITEFNRYGVISSLIIGFLFLILFMSAPSALIKIFVNVNNNPEILQVGPNLIRLYFISVPLLSINVYYTYYYQSVKKAGKSFFISILRGFIFPVILIIVLPSIKYNLLFLSVSISETLVFCINLIMIEIQKKKISLKEIKIKA